MYLYYLFNNLKHIRLLCIMLWVYDGIFNSYKILILHIYYVEIMFFVYSKNVFIKYFYLHKFTNKILNAVFFIPAILYQNKKSLSPESYLL